MKFGAVFPFEIGHDPTVIRDFVQTLEGLGYDYILMYEQLVDAPADSSAIPWQEPYILMSYMTAFTDKLEFATGISVLAGRQTVLVAKQIAELDILCGGRLRFGVSAGWNEREFEALGVDFKSRGKRLNEQITLLRRLWTEPFVTFKSEFHSMSEVGINPKPQQQPIPIWIGGFHEIVLKRVGELGEGWLAESETPKSISPKLDKIKGYAEAAGRDPDTIGLEIVDVHLEEVRDWSKWVRDWEARRAGYMSVTTRHAKLTTVQAHIDHFRAFIKAARD
jgi:probable F420-dependent oxidoreductase